MTREVVQLEDGTFGIICDGEIEYDDGFESREEAQAIADAHNAGAETYTEAALFVLLAKR